jgi:simple sugar transport system permease protein
MWCFFAVALYSWLLLEHSKLGISIGMIGCNPVAAKYSGIKVKSVLIRTYVIAGVLAGIAGAIMASRYNSAKESYGSSYLLQSVAACVLGGTDINGGSGKILGTIIAVLILQVISSGLNIFGLNRYLTTVITGLVMIIVLAINYIQTMKKGN